jgi:hypothetical protein
VNKRRLAAIAKWLEAGAPHKKGVVGFDMTDVLVAKSCGTACCIAGAAQSFFGSTPEIRSTQNMPAKFSTWTHTRLMSFFALMILTSPANTRQPTPRA